MTLATQIQSVIDAGNQIDQTFPIPGQDNNTQGFRDNFSNAQAGIVTAGAVLGTLNSTTAKLGEDNDFSAGQISNANFANSKGVVQSLTASTATTSINVANGEYFRVQLATDVDAGQTYSTLSLRFVGWPASDSIGHYRKVRFELYSNGNNAFHVNFASNTPYTNIKFGDQSHFDPLIVSDNASHRTIIDVWVSDPDDGSVFIQYIGEFIE